MNENSVRDAKVVPSSTQADPDSGSAFLLEQADVSLEQQSLRGIDLFKAALANGNLTAAASALKHLSELHGLNRPKDQSEAAQAGALAALSDEALDRLIADLRA